ncbi:MAG: mechanosensitive ion channel family protein [Candidatus Aminicenantes bacterium]|nr:mechanosensitive ion channel family protein [Candidatus Aminicenantes bacterium]
MTNVASVPVSVYQDLAVACGVLVVIVVLSVLARSAFNRVSGTKKKGRLILISRLAFPLVSLGTLWAAQAILSLSPAMESYLNAATFFFVIVLVIRLVDGAILAWYTDRHKAYPLPNVLRGLVLGIVLLVALFAILKNMLAMDISNLLAGSAILTAVIGLALQGVLGNILAGMSLHFTHAFKQGDWISLGTYEGVVMDTNWRETRILDRSSNIVILPNNVVSAVAPAAEVLAAMLEAARECSFVVTEPKPKAYLASYDETGISYTLKFWVEDFGQKPTIITDVGRLVWYKMRRRGFEVAVSWTDRLGEMKEAIQTAGGAGGGGRIGGMVTEAPAEDKKPGPGLRTKKESEDDRTAEVLLGSTFLRYQDGEKTGELMVPESELRAMAGRIRRSAFTKGEVLFRQGDKGSSCFVVARGRIKGEIVYEENGKRFAKDFEAGPGGLFGEMSLFTGMPRTATGVIAEESELLEIAVEDFRSLLVRNPEPAEAIADIVSARNAQNKEFLLKIKELSAQQVEDSANRHTVLAYLKRFIHGLLG